jgi:7-cyano-7-deazaguanine reductase
MVTEIEKIASVHLGKAGDGSVVKPYITPDTVDASLLVGIPRSLNRTHYNIEPHGPGAVGVDVWNAYEVSFLLSNGFPMSCYARIVYDSESPCIVESKSIKLYLNSFNMMRIDTVNAYEALCIVEDMIRVALIPVLGTIPTVGVHLAYTEMPESKLGFDFNQLETLIDYQNTTYDQVNEDPDILKTNISKYAIDVKTSLLRSNCRVTNQPDWGDVYISMESENGVPTYDSLAKYIVSMRKENHFHEEICECIYKRLYDLYKPTNLVVACMYTRRGGIDINPIRYSSLQYFSSVFLDFASVDVTLKTTRQ